VDEHAYRRLDVFYNLRDCFIRATEKTKINESAGGIFARRLKEVLCRNSQ